MSYNGWTNWETWNINLWIVNDEGLYNVMIKRRPFTPESAKDFILEMYPNGTPDMCSPDSYNQEEMKDILATHKFETVNWEELANSWNQGE